MTNPMGTFVPKPSQTGDRFQPSQGKNRPLIVQVIGVDGARQVQGQNGQGATVKKAVFVHVWDLVGGPVAKDEHDNIVMGPPNTVYCNVQWLSGAVADNLEPFVGAAPMPIKISSQRNKQNTFNYLTVAPVEGQELQYCNQVFAQDPTRFDREFAAKQQAAAAQAAAPAYQANGFQPMGVQPSQPQQYAQGGPVPPAQPQYAPAAAQLPPMPQQPAPGPIANVPAQVAQQWSPVDQAMQQGVLPEQALVSQQASASPPWQATPEPAQQNYAQPGYPPAMGPQYGAPQQAPGGYDPNAYRHPAQAQPQFQAAPGMPGADQVNSSDVQQILARLAQGQPQQ